MDSQRPFPSNLLDKPIKEKIAYFQSIIVPHVKLRKAAEQLQRQIISSEDTKILFVFGPTGVGKTTLLQKTQSNLIEAVLPDLIKNPGKIATASVEAISAEHGKFSHKDYYIRGLEVLKENLIEYKEKAYIPQELDVSIFTSAKDAPGLRRALEKVFIHRQLLAFMVDEAQHMFTMSSAHQMLQQMNWLKSMANLTGTVHVLFGTYELLSCSGLSGQVSRRSADIHISRYNKDSLADVKEFNKIIQTFQHYVPVMREPALESWNDYLLDNSIGCVGTLENWLTRAIRVALEEENKTLLKRHLEQTKFSESRKVQILSETVSGEKKIEDKASGNSIERLDAVKQEQPSNPSGQKRVGQRNPARDPVGAP